MDTGNTAFCTGAQKRLQMPSKCWTPKRAKYAHSFHAGIFLHEIYSLVPGQKGKPFILLRFPEDLTGYSLSSLALLPA